MTANIHPSAGSRPEKAAIQTELLKEKKQQKKRAANVDEGPRRGDPRAVELLSRGREKEPHRRGARLPF